MCEIAFASCAKKTWKILISDFCFLDFSASRSSRFAIELLLLELFMFSQLFKLSRMASSFLDFVISASL